MALNGHLRIHRINFHKSIENQKKTIENKNNNFLAFQKEKYIGQPVYCLNCGIKLTFEQYKKNYKTCSNYCRTAYGNKQKKLSDETKNKIAYTLKSKNKCLKKEKIYKCVNCNKEFLSTKKRKYCSKKCLRESLSSKRINEILKYGTNNLGTKLIFEYNNFKINCDSKLEAAAIIYLFEVLKASHIERFNSILSFKDAENCTHKFNPDFFTIINNTPTIVEVKQLWKNSLKINNYNRYFLEKKEAIKFFATQKGYNWLWLDFDYDIKLKQIYRKLLKKLKSFKNSLNISYSWK